MLRVAVLLSCYHGTKWIEEQIASIDSELASRLVIVLRDDDELCQTSGFVRESINTNCSVEIEFLESSRRLGPSLSFWKLLSYAEHFDFYFFCDQDDIWFPTKIDCQISRLIGLGGDGPAICFSDSFLLGEGFSKERTSYLSKVGLPGQALSCWEYLLINNVAGNSLCINREMRDLLLEMGAPESAIMHDWWIALVASFLGRVYFVRKPLLWYRQHDSNTIGAVGIVSRLWGYLRGKVQAPATVSQRLAQAREFRRLAGDRLDPATRSRLDALLAAPLPVQRLRLIWIRVKMLGLSTVSRFHARFD